MGGLGSLNSLSSLSSTIRSLGGVYKPPQWSSAPAMVTITATVNTTQTTHSTPVPLTGQTQTGVPVFQGQSTSSTVVPVTTTYVFDAVLALEHEQRAEKTQHPVQTGATISSHAFIMPARLMLEVGMSDAMAAYSDLSNDANQITAFSGNPSKSVAAYQQMITFMYARQPLTVTTRLRTYQNMIITSVRPREDHRTITGLRMIVELEQIFTAYVSSVPFSSRGNITDSTGQGAVDTQSPTQATLNQFGVTAASGAQNPPPDLAGYVDSIGTVQGAGSFSSVNTNVLGGKL